jgi:hypothetical protein
MKAVMTSDRFSGDGWIFECTLDGIRCIATNDHGPLRREHSPVADAVGERGGAWVEPQLVAQVAFADGLATDDCVTRAFSACATTSRHTRSSKSDRLGRRIRAIDSDQPRRACRA